ncbi:NUMOD4 motif-containing HNH endonuclease [Mycobacterium sp. TY813]|uniref:NUMOD4 motif-containing HNH endonuclease n=1 Tax=Mycobacterium TaxID=1763 RepID=UPI0027417812|nr:NUMOD4 motif-containing HNH endonuclease [Mycobacterium sp. TY813]MDP7729481.1 NUMOD4 motif-containing HNH endonuclease [Mycobacterium sp. TY813]
MTEERWLPVVGYEGLYEVSDMGRVRSVYRVVTLKNGRRRRAPGRVLKLIRHNGRGNHLVVSLFENNRGKQVLVHHLVLDAFVGPRPEGMVCCHNDGDGSNNRVGNLRWDTYGENNLDLVRHGVHVWASKTHCPRGHEYSAENTRLYRYHGTWRRYCRTCRQIANRARKARLKAERVAAKAADNQAASRDRAHSRPPVMSYGE